MDNSLEYTPILKGTINEKACYDLKYKPFDPEEFIVLYEVERISSNKNIKKAYMKSEKIFVSMKTVFLDACKTEEDLNNDFEEVKHETQIYRAIVEYESKMKQYLMKFINTYYIMGEKKGIKALVTVMESEECTIDELIERIKKNINFHIDLDEDLNNYLTLLYYMLDNLDEDVISDELEVINMSLCQKADGYVFCLKTQIKKGTQTGKKRKGNFKIREIIIQNWKKLIGDKGNSIPFYNEIEKVINSFAADLDCLTDFDNLNFAIQKIFKNPAHKKYEVYFDKQEKLEYLFYRELLEIKRDEIFRSNLTALNYKILFNNDFIKGKVADKNKYNPKNQIYFINAFEYSASGQHQLALQSLKEALNIEEALPDYSESGLLCQLRLKLAEVESLCGNYWQADQNFETVDKDAIKFATYALFLRNRLAWADHERRKGNIDKIAERLKIGPVPKDSNSTEVKELLAFIEISSLDKNMKEIEKPISDLKKVVQKLGRPDNPAIIKANFDLLKTLSFSSSQINLHSSLEILLRKYTSFFLNEFHPQYISILLLIASKEEMDGLYGNSLKTLQRALDLFKEMFFKETNSKEESKFLVSILLSIIRVSRLKGDYNQMEVHLNKIEEALKKINTTATGNNQLFISGGSNPSPIKFCPLEVELKIEWSYYWLFRGYFKKAKNQANMAIEQINRTNDVDSISYLRFGVMYLRFRSLMGLCEWGKANSLLNKMIEAEEFRLENCPDHAPLIIQNSISYQASAQYYSIFKNFDQIADKYKFYIFNLRRNRFPLEKNHQLILNTIYELAFWKFLEGMHKSALKELLDVRENEVSVDQRYQKDPCPSLLDTNFAIAVCKTGLRKFTAAHKDFIDVIIQFHNFYKNFKDLNTVKIAAIHIGHAQNLLLNGDFKVALESINEAKEYLERSDILENHYLKVLCFYTLGQINFILGDRYEALDNFTLAYKMELKLASGLSEPNWADKTSKRIEKLKKMLILQD